MQQQFTQFGQTSAFGHYDILNQISLGFVSALDKLGGDYLGKIFGGGIESSVNAMGIEIGDTVIKNLLAGIDVSAQQFAHVKEIHAGGWFSADWESGYTIYSELDKNVTKMLTLVFKNIGQSLMELAKGLGTDTQAVLDYVFETTQLNLQGMTTEEMSKALNEYFSKIADEAVEVLFGTLVSAYQKLDEGLLETAIRLVIDKDIVLNTLAMTGQAFTGTMPEIIAFSEAIIEMAGGLDNLTEAASTYYDKFFTDAEKQIRLQEQLTGILADMDLIFPETREGYRLLVEGLDLTTEAGQQAYVALLSLSGAADMFYSAVEDAAKAAADAVQTLINSQTSAIEEATNAIARLQTAVLQEATRIAQEYADALDTAVEKQKQLIESLKSISQSITQWISEMTRGSLAPVQSIQVWETEYTRLKGMAQAPGATSKEVSGFLDYAKEYLSFQQSYGTTGSYQDVYEAVMADVKSLQDFTDLQVNAAELQLIATQAADVAARAAAQALITETEKITKATTISAAIAEYMRAIELSSLFPSGNAVMTQYVQEAAAAVVAAGGAVPTVTTPAVTTPTVTTPAVAAVQKVSQGSWYQVGTPYGGIVWNGSFWSYIDPYNPDAGAINTGLSAAAGLALLQKSYGGITFGRGGLTSGLSLAGERGSEWIVPTYEPQRSSFLKSVGADPEAIGNAIARKLQGLGEIGDIHVSVQIDGREIGHVVAKQMKTNPDLQKSVRSLN
jgi:hypothetical protein